MGLEKFTPGFSSSVKTAAPSSVQIADLRPEITAQLAPYQRHFAAGRQILHEGEPGPYCVWTLHGWLALQKSLSDGKVQILDLCLPQDMVFPLLADGRTLGHAASAITDITVCLFSRSDWINLTQRLPQIALRATAVQSVMRARWVERMLRLGRGTAAARIAYLLLELHLRLNQNPNADRGHISLPMTQQQIGDFTGMTFVHVCRVMKTMTKIGHIAIGSKNEVILQDIKALCAVAQVDLNQLKQSVVLINGG